VGRDHSRYHRFGDIGFGTIEAADWFTLLNWLAVLCLPESGASVHVVHRRRDRGPYRAHQDNAP
jgi:hypothetical protein